LAILKLVKNIAEKDLQHIDALLKQAKFVDLTLLINRDYVEKLATSYEKQIILTIQIFSLLKLHQYDQVKELFAHNDIEFKNAIFCYKFLEAKYYYLTVKIEILK
jgi:hypothetical protein